MLFLCPKFFVSPICNPQAIDLFYFPPKWMADGKILKYLKFSLLVAILNIFINAFNLHDNTSNLLKAFFCLIQQ